MLFMASCVLLTICISFFKAAKYKAMCALSSLETILKGAFWTLAFKLRDFLNADFKTSHFVVVMFLSYSVKSCSVHAQFMLVT